LPTAGFAFSETRLDRCAERRDDEAWLAAQRADARAQLLVVRHDGKLPIDADSTLVVLGLNAIETERSASFLGLDSDRKPWFAVALDADAATRVHGGRFADLRALAPVLPAGIAGSAAYARALLHWQSRKRFCGRCGAATVFGAGGHRATCSDPGCGQQYFPRTDPAIIVLVTDGSRCLLGRQPSWTQRRFSTLAGFVEPGESLEAAVAREVEEESGVRVSSAHYVASQPWPFPTSLMLGFEAAAASHAIRVGAELCEAHWFEIDAIPAAIERGELVLPPGSSISFHLIDRWFSRTAGSHLTPGPVLTAR
jgi:NAD+ diphosphatase